MLWTIQRKRKLMVNALASNPMNRLIKKERLPIKMKRAAAIVAGPEIMSVERKKRTGLKIDPFIKWTFLRKKVHLILYVIERLPEGYYDNYGHAEQLNEIPLLLGERATHWFELV